MLLAGLVFGLAVGWFVSLFGGNILIIQGVLELTGKEIGNAGYYTIFALLGAISALLKNRS